ncbi:MULTISPECIES: CatB-related O-acetyltransferase [unclassified Lactococcus]|uniref:CatB-related O-acetyltransferase n=1 Tax=unclassified Lactococcus TaxID=2643510 RepID=UPI0011C89995|nr:MULTISPECIES: CatB-related O-acetyltransferase [unclassified Lactococcus]MQW23114.1 chloramphenicol acetyltransferase [Lactococcus sp. dk101]TXK44168.1 CatB-related O-acetyltransferase [Lactococcus sp. dk310]TXK49899.1 CatB-related O-acetyltransferase [Lactococcus sp. dk322]
MEKTPNPNALYSNRSITSMTNIKPTLKNKKIEVGDFTYFSDDDFESHVTHHYDFIGDKLVIGKFCQIAKGVEFIMNGANHQMNAVSTFPFYIFDGWTQEAPSLDKMPLKGDTRVGNDVWIGQNVTVMPGVHIGDGAMIGANSTVASDIEAYSIVAGNPAKLIRMRFDEVLINLMAQLKWWEKPIYEINRLIPLLTDNDLEKVKVSIKKYLEQEKQK